MIKKTTLLISLSFIVFFGVFTSCKSHIKYSLQNLPSNYITYGSYGGFSGNQITYYFFPNGQLFVTQSLTNETSELKSLKRKETKTVFRELEKSDFLKLQENKPGNMSYFLESYSMDTLTNRVVWGANGQNAPEAIKDFTNHLDGILLNLPSDIAPTSNKEHNDHKNE